MPALLHTPALAPSPLSPSPCRRTIRSTGNHGCAARRASPPTERALEAEDRMAIQVKKVEGLTKADAAIWRDLDVIELCAIETAKGKAVCATPRGSRYPYVYPRDNAQCARALGKLVTYSAN